MRVIFTVENEVDTSIETCKILFRKQMLKMMLAYEGKELRNELDKINLNFCIYCLHNMVQGFL